MTMEPCITVAVVDDDAEFRALVRETLVGPGVPRLIAQCADAETALAMLPGLRPDVVLMDIQLKGASGIECIGHLKPRLPGTQFMMLTVFEDDDRIFDSLRAGALGYLVKRGVSARLVDAIRDLHAGHSPISPGIARRLIQTLPPLAAAVLPAATGEPLEVSPRERQILEGLARGRQYKEIADELGLSFHTVRTHVARIYEKLQVHSRIEAVRQFEGRGVSMN